MVFHDYRKPKLFPYDYFRPEHFSEWVKANRPTLLSTAARYVGHDAAEDCLQDAITNTWLFLHCLPKECPLSDFLTFFQSKLRTACRAHIRNCVRRSEVLMAPNEVLSLAERLSTDSTLSLPDISGTQYAGLREELYERLDRACLTPKQEACIRQWLDGVNQRGIAEYLGISQATVHEHIGAAVEKLRTLLHWDEPVGRQIWDWFWEFVQERKDSIYRRPARSRKKFRQREKKEEAR